MGAKSETTTRREMAAASRSKGSGPVPPTRLSRLHKPPGMTLEEWQTELRRQHGQQQDFEIKNIGNEPISSEYLVTNPVSKRTYRVAIRGREAGSNYCSCPDFATNALGTCKHIEFMLARLARKRGGATALRQGFRPPYSEVYLRYGARREVRFQAGRDCPDALVRLARAYFDKDGNLELEAFSRFEKFLSGAADIDHELRCYPDTLAFLAEVRDAEGRRERMTKAFPEGAQSKALEKLLTVPMYEYQCEGALFASRAGRCLIGDDMGLGKTVEAIAAVEIMAQQLGVERALVICPTSLKHQWASEIARFADRSVEVIGGLRVRRREQFEAKTFYKITNYDTVHRDLDLIQAWSPDLVILDEAQRIKNWNTRTARSVKRISSPYAMVLTGTPLENRLEELVSIVDFIDLHRLGPTYRLLDSHQIRDESGRVVGYRDLDQIGKTLEPILIRRRKGEVLQQLPPRLEKRFFVPMTPQQAQHHEENRETVARIAAKWRRYHYLSEADQRRLMIALQNMRMSCDSTYLLDPTTNFNFKVGEIATLLEEIYEQPDSKVVIFSQWVRMHELLLQQFRERDWDHVFFHGGVESTKRGGLIERFRQVPGCRAFLSTDAGGVGLNLQHADVVINVDLPWNPAVLEQRIGRVHRLGQTRPVRVVNFIAEGTIEEGILSLLGFKKSLFSGILDGTEKDVFLGGSRLSRFIETVEKATSAISAPVVETVAEAAAAAYAAAEPETAEPEAEPQAAMVAATSAVDPLTGLLQSGLALLDQLAAASRPSVSGTTDARLAGDQAGPFQVGRDESSGESYLRIRMPEPEVLNRALQAIGSWLEGLRK